MPSGNFDSKLMFSEQLWYYYTVNRGKIRSRYNDLTRKFLAYNDAEENPEAFLRKPQFEALEMYIFIKEFMNNAQVYEMFDDWRNHRGSFSDASYYSVTKGGQTILDENLSAEQTDTLFKQMKKYRESYPNYIYALTMGLGKTLLMATCIFYEFLLAKKYPRDKRFCHNALVFAPDKTVLQSLREIMTFDKKKVVPNEYAGVLDSNIKFHFLDETGTILHTIDDSDFNIVISNTQKIIVKKKRKEVSACQTLFDTSGLLSAVYGGEDSEDAWDDTTLMDNQRFKKLCRLPQLGVYVDEAHLLFGVALFRNPSSKIFVLQATMRCLRSITKERHTATIFLSKESFDILDDELHKNFNMNINDLKEPSNAKRRKVQVHVMPPQRSIRLKHVWHEYSLRSKEYSEPLDFKLAETDFSKYRSKIYERESIAADTTVKEKNADYIRDGVRYSKLTLIGEISRYLNISCITVSRILDESVDGTEYILETVNKYNAVLDEIIIPSIFHALFEVTSEIKSEERELILLKEPKNAGYYEFSAKEDLILTNRYLGFTPEQIGKSFHADVYCFDSGPEKECFRQYITSDRVKEIYFTGMFTSNQGDLLVHYYDPESGRIRQYYPDFLAKMSDGTYRLIEVKGDNKIDDSIVKAKQQAAEEMATASGIEYFIYRSSELARKNVLEDKT